MKKKIYIYGDKATKPQKLNMDNFIIWTVNKNKQKKSYVIL